jgi:hypothetical protein
VPQWPTFSGNADGILDPPVTQVAVELLHEAGGPSTGSILVDDLQLVGPDEQVQLVADFELTAPVHAWSDTLTALRIADLDQDGALDVILTASQSGTGEHLRVLLGHAAAEPAGDTAQTLSFADLDLGGLAFWEEGVSWAVPMDPDHNGDLDLCLITPAQDRLLLGDGTGHLFDDTAAALPVDWVLGRHAAAADLDLDGRADLVVANDGEANRIYTGTADGRFADRTPALGLAREATTRVLLFDADGDGDLDILVINRTGPRLVLYASVKASNR